MPLADTGFLLGLHTQHISPLCPHALVTTVKFLFNMSQAHIFLGCLRTRHKLTTMCCLLVSRSAETCAEAAVPKLLEYITVVLYTIIPTQLRCCIVFNSFDGICCCLHVKPTHFFFLWNTFHFNAFIFFCSFNKKCRARFTKA